MFQIIFLIVYLMCKSNAEHEFCGDRFEIKVFKLNYKGNCTLKPLKSSVVARVYDCASLCLYKNNCWMMSAQHLANKNIGCSLFNVTSCVGHLADTTENIAMYRISVDKCKQLATRKPTRKVITTTKSTIKPTTKPTIETTTKSTTKPTTTNKSTTKPTTKPTTTKPTTKPTPINLALGGNASQSSPYQDNDPRVAIDGVIVNSNFIPTGCSHTEREVKPWFSLDLLHVYMIEKVVIYNRIEDTAPVTNRRTTGFKLSILDENDAVTKEQPVEMVNIKMKEFSVYNHGRYVRIHTSSTESKILSICEIQVWGFMETD